MVLALVALVAAVVLAHYAYYLWPVSSDRRWAKYVGDGAGFAVLCALIVVHAHRIRAPLLVFAAGWGVIDGSQQAVCGSLRWGTVISGTDLCIEQFGPWPYVALSSGLLAWVITRKK